MQRERERKKESRSLITLKHISSSYQVTRASAAIWRAEINSTHTKSSLSSIYKIFSY